MRNTDLKLAIILLMAFVMSCKSDKSESSNKPFATVVYNPIKVVSEGMEFQMRDTLEAGWNTFKYQNKSNEVHFFLLEKLPEGIRIANYKNELIPPFKKATELLLQGKVDEGLKQFETIPTWFSKVKVSGGVGLISPNVVGESTFYLDPGIYAMECYVRMPNGMAHVYYGMLKEVIVIDRESQLEPPKASVNLSVSSKEGIVLNDSITAGNHIFGVHFKDQTTYKTMLGHDVNLVRLDDFALVDTLNNWINAADLNAFRSPAPKGITFLGGINDLQTGATGYFKASLTPGNYAFISEVPNAKEKGLLKTFKVID
ncbi:hypothetical protein [Winogradskyella poriferorum]|uniref:hypothetical protein n=1 Tax=Winogradskyella poriferorum TaxID=307627 RepID=UPI003D658D93